MKVDNDKPIFYTFPLFIAILKFSEFSSFKEYTKIVTIGIIGEIEKVLNVKHFIYLSKVFCIHSFSLTYFM